MALDLTLPLLDGAWRVDPSRSRLGFAIRHLGVATVHGHFTSFAARVHVQDSAVTVDGQVDAASVDTGDGIRDGRLRSEFFVADRFPAIAFRADGGGPAHGHSSQLTALLTIRDVTRPVTLRVVAEPIDDANLRLVAEGAIRRSDFDLEWDALRKAGRLLVSDRVRLAVDVLSRTWSSERARDVERRHDADRAPRRRRDHDQV